MSYDTFLFLIIICVLLAQRYFILNLKKRKRKSNFVLVFSFVNKMRSLNRWIVRSTSRLPLHFITQRCRLSCICSFIFLAFLFIFCFCFLMAPCSIHNDIKIAASSPDEHSRVDQCFMLRLAAT